MQKCYAGTGARYRLSNADSRDAGAHRIQADPPGHPRVVNLLADDAEELEFGHVSPPPATYWGITVHMHPADADARDLPNDVSMTGLVLHVKVLFIFYVLSCAGSGCWHA